MDTSKNRISIIIPIYNNRIGLERTLKAISKQSYPIENFEVFVIDNGSVDKPSEVITIYDSLLQIFFLEELNNLNSPYSARNRGIEKSSGDIIVLLDSTCAPVEKWIEAGLNELKKGADLVGGNVTFDINEKSSIGEMYDSLSNIRMKETIQKKNAAKTTNLFIKKEVFDTIGNFPEGLRSGGDVRWTNRATRHGFSLVFSNEAEVIMTARGLKRLIKKQYRVGKGHPKVWQEAGVLSRNVIIKILLFWLPPNPVRIKRAISTSDKSFLSKYFIPLFMIGWYLRIVNAVGSVSGMRTIFNQKH